jgi:bacteriophage N4 adsorption protein A
MKLFSTLLALVLAVPTVASAQAIDLGGDVTGYTRFLVYPHLQKGLEAMRRGDHVRALAELEQARRLAPVNGPVALQLAAAYRMFGQPERAESLLREQIAQTPGDARLRTALADLLTIRKPLAHGSPSPPGSMASVPVRPPPSLGPGRRAVPPPQKHPVRVGQPVATSMVATATRGASFTQALETHRFDDAQEQADAWLALDQGAALLDPLTYQLVAAGGTGQATRVLLRTYPFAGRAAAERDTLLQRLILLIEQHPGILSDEQLLSLRQPLDTPALRSRQGALWVGLHDCDAAVATLRDMSSAYAHDDWMRLGDCSTGKEPALARQAYTLAQALEPGGRASRALAYHAHGAGDFRAALDQWRSVGAERLSGDDLLAAVSSAMAAVEPEQAATWLNTYRERGDALTRRYWSLFADSHMTSDPPAAAAALQHAIDLQPEGDDYVRLARLESEPTRQVKLLERAAALDPGSAGTQAALGYAYLRAGRPAPSLAAFVRAGALDPANMNVQIELGYGSWRAGRAVEAQHALERASHADPANQILLQQLVYVHQRLKHNDEALRYAEQVLDALSESSAPSPGSDAEAADRRFGFQRLHEDLDRRVTFNLDGFGGTGVGTVASASQPGSNSRSYSQFEADVRLGRPPVRDGSTLSVYARVLADGGDLHSPVPSHDAILGVGLRWKPWRSQVIYLAAENQSGFADAGRQDFLLRASASFFGGGRSSDDWHPAGPGWFSRNLYVDGAGYLESRHSAFTADYRMSYHRKMSASQTLEPYGHLQFTGIAQDGFQRDARSGAGLRWNIWQGANAYDAPPHKISVGLEVQHAFNTYLPDRNAVFLTLGTHW